VGTPCRLEDHIWFLFDVMLLFDIAYRFGHV
jgi:hypothetical protein